MASAKRGVVRTKSVAAKSRSARLPSKAAATQVQPGRRATSSTAARKRTAATSRKAVTAPRPGKAAQARRTATLAREIQPQNTAIDAHVLAHALNSLLHTMQVVQQHEETLCSLMHALRRGRPGAALLRELRGTLEELPAHAYWSEVEALREAAGA